jgi:hypothetical protein
MRDRQGVLEIQLLSVPAAFWPEAAVKARYLLNLYAAGLAPADTGHRELVAAVSCRLCPPLQGKLSELLSVERPETPLRSRSIEDRTPT